MRSLNSADLSRAVFNALVPKRIVEESLLRGVLSASHYPTLESQQYPVYNLSCFSNYGRIHAGEGLAGFGNTGQTALLLRGADRNLPTRRLALGAETIA